MGDRWRILSVNNSSPNSQKLTPLLNYDFNPRDITVGGKLGVGCIIKNKKFDTYQLSVIWISSNGQDKKCLNNEQVGYRGEDSVS